MSGQAEEARAKLATLKDGSEWEKYQAGARLRRFEDLLKSWKRPADPTPLQVEIQALRIGELALIAMPGEPFAEIGAAVRAKSPFPFTMFCGYSNGKGGDYLPIASEYKHGGYEVERTPYGSGAADKVIAAAIALAEQVR
jgi:hypothetical protein